MTLPFNPPLEMYEIRESFPYLSDVEILKSGGEGTVIKAFDSKINDYVAIKIYSSNHHKTRTELEVNKLRKIRNPYIVSLYNHGEVILRGENCYFTETTYIDGNDLRVLLNAKRKFSPKEVENIIKCISSAIDSLWQEKVVHCDIKPDNILSNNGDYVLIDLGVAKHFDISTITAANMIMGTLGYLAPEQFNGRKNITLKADYYALGITAYELLVGYHPFNMNQMAMLNNKIQSFPLNIPIPTKLKNLIFKMTDPIPYNRPINHIEICKDLEGV